MEKPTALAIIVLLGTASFFCAGCEHTYDAQVKLDNLIKLDSARFGHLNSVFVKAGDIINLDSSKNPPTATRVGTIPATTAPTVVLDTLDAAAGNSLTVSFTGKTPPVGDLNTALTTTITNSTALNLVNPSAVEIEDIFSTLNAADAKSQLDALYSSASANHQVLVIVTKLIKADDLKFTFSGATSVSGSVSQMKIGDYTLNVDYTDNVSLHAAAVNSVSRNTGIFFKVAQIGKTSDGKYVPENTNDVDLSAYNMGDTFTAH